MLLRPCVAVHQMSWFVLSARVVCPCVFVHLMPCLVLSAKRDAVSMCCFAFYTIFVVVWTMCFCVLDVNCHSCLMLSAQHVVVSTIDCT